MQKEDEDDDEEEEEEEDEGGKEEGDNDDDEEAGEEKVNIRDLIRNCCATTNKTKMVSEQRATRVGKH